MNAFWIALICLGGVLLLLFLISFAMMCAASLHAQWLVRNVDHAIQHSSLRRYEKELNAGRKWLAEQPQEEVYVTAYDGVRLFGRYVPYENARGTALLFHGWRSIGDIDFSCALEFYASLGLNLLLVDQRAHGRSGGRFTTYGIRERRDVHTWVDRHNERFGETPLLLAGLSMGAATVLMSCGEPFPKNVRGVIADCGFTSPYDIIGKVIRDNHLPAKLLLPLIDLQTTLFAGFSLKEYSTLDAMKRTKLPVLLVHGEADAFVPCEMSRRVFEACASTDKTLLTVPNAGHGQSYLIDREKYQRTARAFIERALKNDRKAEER